MNSTESPAVVTVLWWFPYIAALDWLCLIASLPGNLLTIIACIKFVELRTPTNLLILNQCVGDLYSALAVSNGVANTYTFAAKELSMKNKYYCLVSLFGMFVGFQTSFLNVMVLSMERFTALVFTFRYYTLVTSQSVQVTVGLLWGLTIITHLLPLMGWNTWKKGALCLSSFAYPSTFFNAFFILPCLISLLLTAMANVVIAIIALKKSSRVSDITDEASALVAKTQLRVTKMLLVVVGSFYICWLPYIVLISLLIVSPASWKENGPPQSVLVTFEFSKTFVIFTSLINPFIYAFKDRGFRRAYHKMLGLALPVTNDDSVAGSAQPPTASSRS